MIKANVNRKKDPSKAYLDYLKTEMNYIGLLTIFCLSAFALVLKYFLSSEDTFFHFLFIRYFYLILFLLLSFFVSAAFLNYQRSRLGWYYGRIAMCQIEVIHGNKSYKQWVEEADRWDTWRPYIFATWLIRTTVFTFFVICCLQYKKITISISYQAIIVIALIIFYIFLGLGVHKYYTDKEDSRWIFKVLDLNLFNR